MPYSAAKRKMPVIAEQREAYDHDRTRPSGLAQVIKRHHRAMIERVLAAKLAKRHPFNEGGLLNMVYQVEIVFKRETDARRIEAAEIAPQFWRRTNGEFARVERRMGRYDYDRIGSVIYKTPGKLSQSLAGVGYLKHAVAPDLGYKQRRMRGYSRKYN
jgi:hypothetical protein